MRGLVIGRFQPFHLGHRFLINRIDEEVDEVIVGIGSAGQSHSLKNPFTSGERVHLVQDSLDQLDAKTYLIPIADIDRDAMWVKHIEILCPSFDVVYSNNPFVERLFEEEGYEVRETTLHNREEYCGSEIRRRILDGEEWEHLVPDVVVEAIEEIGGVARLRKIDETDEPDGEDPRTR
ncbi:nicotinamide-nucleotide adenylyltransferase [Natronomonas halophila]|uniref:nicotinamide-nucleotide adenylyltransferase n=1 Tax=Natronomonas halophila TaxID=2747817 RepID=UPI0015B55860|nr:nicotinamide-nucleotide adenylyltransferase [Natronomonas halophila]QLD85552.1 nicotinamide-nucleotide adenylyltransferase [Natronomonas halophila]